jgi:hypothetical protein
MNFDQNKFLITQIQEFVDQADKEKAQERHEKDSFWCSEAETPVFDLYHRWIGTTPTNPPEAEKQMIFMAGKMMELALVETLGKMDLLEKPEDEQFRVEMEREGVKVTGYMDGVLKGGIPVEIKSYYGVYQTKDLEAGKPRESYLKQLAMYMDFMNALQGKLVYLERGTGQMFEFTLENIGGKKYKCINIEFDLEDTYKRWARLYKNNIVPKIEPKSEYRYKKPLEEIDWQSLSSTDISKARNNQKVIGDHPWAIQYSAFKDLILEREGVKAGYTDAELAKIKELTKGYSTWGKQI